MPRKHLGLGRKKERPAKQLPDAEYNSISIVDMVKHAYEQGMFKQLKADSRKTAEMIDLMEIDAVRLTAYFDKKSEFTRTDNWDCGIHSIEFKSKDLVVEIFETFMTIYRVA